MSVLHRAKGNPVSWKWRLVLLLTGGELEAIPLLPRRAIFQHESLVVKLGAEGSYNTVEVRSMLSNVPDLLPMNNPYTDPAPNTYVAFKVNGATKGEITVVGTFVGWEFRGDIEGAVIEDPDNGDETWIERSVITDGYWAPLGYRP